MSAPPTVATATRVLAAAGVPSPGHDARVLAAHAAASGSDFEELVAARAARIPLQHLVGSAGFRYLDLLVGPGVFVPRPETELLVDAVLAAIDSRPDPLVVDLCAGSGAIGLSVAHEHPTAQVHLVERSAAAHEWLVRNAAGRERVHVHLADLAAAPVGFDGAVDAVVANPPYVPHDERELVDAEVREHDPEEALWADEGGLAVIRRVVDRARTLLRPGGSVVIEHSERHEHAAPELLWEAGFEAVADHHDLTGRPRYVVGVAPW